MDEQTTGTLERKSVLLLSGGLDSTTCAALLTAQGWTLTGLFVDYGQLTASEERAAAMAVANHYGFALHSAHLPTEAYWRVPLTGEGEIPLDRSAVEMHSSIAPTFVPHRNLLLLTMAAAIAYPIGASVALGVNSQDYSGYPDCRETFIKSAQQTLSKSTGDQQIKILTPIIHMSKRQIVEAAIANLAPIAATISCYRSQPACGRCDSCLLRESGFHQAGLTDPAIAP